MKLSAAMTEALKFMAGNGGTSIGPGCPSTDATFEALRKGMFVWKNCRHYELTKAGEEWQREQKLRAIWDEVMADPAVAAAGIVFAFARRAYDAGVSATLKI